MAAQRKTQQAASRTRTTVRSGQQRGSHLHMVCDPHIFITEPFWSDAHQAYKVEYHERVALDCVGGSYTSYFLCKELAHAQQLSASAKKVTNREGWMKLREVALEIAASAGQGTIWRIMTGGSESFGRKQAAV